MKKTGGWLILAGFAVLAALAFPQREAAAHPPTLSCSIRKTVLWPPNHNLIDVGLQVTARDNNDPRPVVTVSVFADEEDEEQTGDGNHSPDAKPGHSFTPGCYPLRLRSERKGDADGRVYLIIVTARDRAGSTTTKCCTVVVPHDQSRAAQASIIAQAQDAERYCMANGAAPPEFVPVGDGPIIGPKQ